MFFKSTTPSTRTDPEMPETRKPKAGQPSLIAETVEITGDIVMAGELQLEGRIKGNLRCLALVMGETGAIEGEIHAETIVIRGQVNGSIHGHTVRLEKTAIVDGDVYHESLAVEAGARLSGRFSYLSETPKLEAAKKPKSKRTKEPEPNFLSAPSAAE